MEKLKRGRKKKENSMTKRIFTRCTEEQEAAWCRAAESDGELLRNWIRKTLDDKAGKVY